MAPDVEVIHSPGHYAEHIALLLRQEDVLIAGDICSNVMGLVTASSTKTGLWRKSILQVAEYPFERAVFGYGKSIGKQANALLKRC